MEDILYNIPYMFLQNYFFSLIIDKHFNFIVGSSFFHDHMKKLVLSSQISSTKLYFFAKNLSPQFIASASVQSFLQILSNKLLVGGRVY